MCVCVCVCDVCDMECVTAMADRHGARAEGGYSAARRLGRCVSLCARLFFSALSLFLSLCLSFFLRLFVSLARALALALFFSRQRARNKIESQFVRSRDSRTVRHVT